MHTFHKAPKSKNGPETTGATLPGRTHYDIFSGLLGMGVNGPNSRMVVKLAQVKPGDHILDVACGTGSLTLTTQSFAGPDGKVYGIDASPEMIEIAKKKASRLAPHVIFQVGLSEKLDFTDATFDVAISRLAIHHLPDDLKRRAFSEILRVLKPGGHLLIADFKAPRNPVLNHITSAVVGPHMMQTNVWSLPAMLADTGFVDVTWGPTRSAILAFVSAKKSTN
jgi:ubiquinone/menaquinone biosynthesis C-methylase UbiE